MNESLYTTRQYERIVNNPRLKRQIFSSDNIRQKQHCIVIFAEFELTRIISSVFNSLLDGVVFRKVIPSDYRLFQVADLVCTMTLIEMKQESHMLSKSELLFFGDERTLKKN